MAGIELDTGLPVEVVLGSRQLQLGVGKTVLEQADLLDVYVDLMSADGEKTSARSQVDTLAGRLSVTRFMRFRDEHTRPTVITREEAHALVTEGMRQDELMQRYRQRGLIGRSIQVTRFAINMASDYIPQNMRYVSLPDVIVTDMYPENILDVFVSREVEDRFLLQQAS